MTKFELLSQTLPIGRENAVTRAELMERLNLPDRETRALVERLRRSGAVVCSDERGYYRPAGIDELRIYVRKCRKRRQSEYEINRGAERQLKRWEEQAAFDGGSLLDLGGGAHE